MTFEVGKAYRTRGGGIAEVTGTGIACGGPSIRGASLGFIGAYHNRSVVMTFHHTDGSAMSGEAHLDLLPGAIDKTEVIGILKARLDEAEARFEVAESRLDSLVEALQAAKIEIMAAKKFGGGFYGDVVTDETRALYRRMVTDTRAAFDRINTRATLKGSDDA